MAKRKTVLRIEGLSSPEAPEEAIAASEEPQVAAVEEPQEQKPAEVPQEAPAAAEEPKARQLRLRSPSRHPSRTWAYP